MIVAVAQDPVIAADGHSYDRASIQEWLRTSKLSPKTGLELESCNLIPNIALKSLVQEFLQDKMKTYC